MCNLRDIRFLIYFIISICLFVRYQFKIIYFPFKVIVDIKYQRSLTYKKKCTLSLNLSTHKYSHLFLKANSNQRTGTFYKRVRRRTEALKECGRAGGRAGRCPGGRLEGQRLWNWFCFLYVSDVLRLPAPSRDSSTPPTTQRVSRRADTNGN